MKVLFAGRSREEAVENDIRQVTQWQVEKDLKEREGGREGGRERGGREGGRERGGREGGGREGGRDGGRGEEGGREEGGREGEYVETAVLL